MLQTPKKKDVLSDLTKDVRDALNANEDASSVVVVSSDHVAAWRDGKEIPLNIRPDDFVEDLLRRDGYHIVVIKK